MHMSYENFITMQLVYVTCRKGRVQPPTRKGGEELFRRTSDYSSRFAPINIHEDEPKAPRVRDTMTE